MAQCHRAVEILGTTLVILVSGLLLVLHDLNEPVIAVLRADAVFIALAFTPLVLSLFLAYDLGPASQTPHFRLLIRPNQGAGERWGVVERSVAALWRYERERFARSLRYASPAAIAFGAITTLLLGYVLAHFLISGGLTAESQATRLDVAVGTTVLTGFLLSFAGISVRVSKHDVNARMFSWGLRSTLFAGIASGGMVLVLGDGIVGSHQSSMLLGVVVAVLGDRAIPLLLERAAATFGIGKQTDPEDSLKKLDRMTSEDIDRLAEEGVLSCHDLAFAPTAGLFFNTTYSLQKLCDWQDQALLRVYVGPTRAAALSDKLAVRGAIDFMGLANMIRGMATAGPSEEKPTEALIKSLRNALSKALGADDDALEALIEMIKTDEVTMRLRVHWDASPLAVEDSRSGALDDSGRGRAESPLVVD